MKKRMGVTLIELLIALVCMIVMIGVVYQLILITERVHIRTGVRVEAEYSIRETLDLMMSELKHAGYRHWDVLDSNPHPDTPNFAYNISRIGTDSDTNTITFEMDRNESGVVGDNERITYKFFPGTKTLCRGVDIGASTDWEVVANNLEDVRFTYIGTSGNTVNLPTTNLSVLDGIRSVNIGLVFANFIKGEGKTITTTMDTNVRLRNTYYTKEVKNILQ
ncbi:MAG: hypothetical protein AB1297_04845 [bacterium]